MANTDSLFSPQQAPDSIWLGFTIPRPPLPPPFTAEETEAPKAV